MELNCGPEIVGARGRAASRQPASGAPTMTSGSSRAIACSRLPISPPSPPLPAHFGGRRDRLIIGRERIARAADDRYCPERHLPDLRIVGRKRVAEGELGRAVLG